MNCLSCRGLFSAKYENEYLSRRLKEIFGTRQLKDSLVPVQVVAVDLNRNKPVYFSTLDTPNVLMVDAALATTAAPTFFPVHHFKLNTVYYYCIDGGVCENNPVASALKQANKFIFKKNNTTVDEHKFKVVSIGTGYVARSLDIKGLSNAGKIKWAPEIIEIAIDATSFLADVHTKELFHSSGAKENYFRLQIPIAESDSKLDNSRQENLSKLRSSTDSFVSHDENYKAMLEKLKAPLTLSEHNRSLINDRDFDDLEIEMHSAQGEIDENDLAPSS